jgi:hypothetical protein
MLEEFREMRLGATGIEAGETITPTGQISEKELFLTRLTFARQALSSAAKKISLTCVTYITISLGWFECDNARS